MGITDLSFFKLIHFGLLRNTRSHRLIINENACVCCARVGVGALLIALWKHTDAQPMRETLYIACIARPSPRRERERAESMEVSRRDSDAALPGRPRSRYSWAAAGYMLIAVAKPASRARAEPAPRGGGERAEGAEA